MRAGSTFVLGTTLVVYTAIDTSGNAGNCSFTVTVVDREPPSIACPVSQILMTEPGKCASWGGGSGQKDGEWRLLSGWTGRGAVWNGGQVAPMCSATTRNEEAVLRASL